MFVGTPHFYNVPFRTCVTAALARIQSARFPGPCVRLSLYITFVHHVLSSEKTRNRPRTRKRRNGHVDDLGFFRIPFRESFSLDEITGIIGNTCRTKYRLHTIRYRAFWTPYVGLQTKSKTCPP